MEKDVNIVSQTKTLNTRELSRNKYLKVGCQNIRSIQNKEELVDEFVKQELILAICETKKKGR